MALLGRVWARLLPLMTISPWLLESFCPYRATGVWLPLPRAIALGYEGLPFQGAWMKED